MLLFICSAELFDFSLTGSPDWNAEPFDFLIDGELIRMSLEQFLLAKGISAVMISFLLAGTVSCPVLESCMVVHLEQWRK